MASNAIKYCGGCNPRYDRSKAVQNLERQLKEKLPVARPGEKYQTIYLICGCSARCVNTSQLHGERFVIIDEFNYRELECK